MSKEGMYIVNWKTEKGKLSQERKRRQIIHALNLTDKRNAQR